MLWIKEVEMVESVEELLSSRSIEGKDFPNFEMLDALMIQFLLTLIYSQSLFATMMFRNSMRDGMKFHHLRLPSFEIRGWLSGGD